MINSDLAEQNIVVDHFPSKYIIFFFIHNVTSKPCKRAKKREEVHRTHVNCAKKKATNCYEQKKIEGRAALELSYRKLMTRKKKAFR